MTSSTRQQLSASMRQVIGKKVKHLRKQGILPAHLFGKDNKSLALQVETKALLKLFKTSGETALVDILIEGETSVRPVLIVSRDFHPVTDEVLHVDFHQVNLKEKVTAQIPVETIGESPAVKAGGVLVIAFNELEVEALPTNLPEKFEVDLSSLLNIGDDFKVSQLVYDRSKVTIQDLEQDEMLVTIQAQQAEEIVPVETTPVDVELTKQGSTKEVVEGETTPAAKPAAAAKTAPKKEEKK